MYPIVIATPVLANMASSTTGFEVVSTSKMKQYKLITLTTTACMFEPILVFQSILLAKGSWWYLEETTDDILGLIM